MMTAKQSEAAPAAGKRRVKKTSAAEQKRLKLGLPNSAVDPELSAKRAAAGMIGSVISRLPGASTYEVAHLAMQTGAKAVVNHGVAIVKQLAKKEAPAVLQRMIELAGGMHDAKPREQIAAGRIVLEVAGALEKENEGGDDSPLTQRSVSALRAVIASGEQRIQELQAAIERQAGLDMGAIEADHRTIVPGDDDAPSRAGTGKSEADSID
jgi:hypothetical protein